MQNLTSGNITAVIADDESHLRKHLAALLKKIWPDLQIVAQAENGEQALKSLEHYQPDIAFLDIKMPGKNGIEVACQVSFACHIVFVTAFDQFAIDAFENQAVDYILKPVKEPRLKKTVQRLKNVIDTQRDRDQRQDFEKLTSLLDQKKKVPYLNVLNVKVGSDIHLIPVEKVFYFKAQDKYTTVQCAEKEYIINTPIKTLCSQLDPEKFCQVHRNAIAGLAHISSLTRGLTGRLDIRFHDCEKTLRVSRTYEKIFHHM